MKKPEYSTLDENNQEVRVASEAPICSAYGIFEDNTYYPKIEMTLVEKSSKKLDEILEYIKKLEERIEKLENK